MAIIADYKFDDGDSYDSAVKRICNEGGSGNSWDAKWPYITIYDDCDYAALAGRICQAYGGKPI